MCQAQSKAVISSEHVLKAIEELEFPFGVQLKECLDAYHKDQSQKKETKKSDSHSTDKVEVKSKEDTTTATQDAEPQKKRQKLSVSPQKEDNNSAPTDTMQQ